jgi:hypothetical protein
MFESLLDGWMQGTQWDAVMIDRCGKMIRMHNTHITQP